MMERGFSSGQSATRNGTVTDNKPLQELMTACKLIARHYDGPQGEFAYECFEHINATLFAGALPWPLIRWALTAHGHCLGFTQSSDQPPVIQLHPSLLGGTEKPDPWNIDPKVLGVCYAYDVLLHECVHVNVQYLLGGWRRVKGQTSHNNPLWIGEVNRLGPLLGLPAFVAAPSKTRRVPVEGQTTKTGKPATRVVRACGGDVPFHVVSGFPHEARFHFGRAGFYRANHLPFQPTPYAGSVTNNCVLQG
jgi:hypothetical protein